MAEESVCEQCGGPVRPTGGRSRGGLGGVGDDDIAWQPWRETGVCIICGAVHRRVADLADAAWRATGMIAAGLAQTLGRREVALAGDVHSRAILSGELTVSTLGAEVTPVDGPPLTLRWGSELEPVSGFDNYDYAMLAVVLTILGTVAALTKDAQDTATAFVLTYAVLTWEPSRAALRRLLRDMQGRE